MKKSRGRHPSKKEKLDQEEEETSKVQPQLKPKE